MVSDKILNFVEEIKSFESLVILLKNCKGLEEKYVVLHKHPCVQERLARGAMLEFFRCAETLDSKLAFLSIVLIDQHRLLFSGPVLKGEVRSVLEMFVAIEHFYESIGGIIGYQLKVLQLLEGKQGNDFGRYSRPTNMYTPEASFVQAGIEALPETGEIYPIGGLGSRLNLLDEEGKPLPVASLPFLGHSLLEGLVRDVEAREHLYYQFFGKEVTIPIALMTSLEKNNEELVRTLCEDNRWFGRPKESFFLFSQLSVPVVNERGEWVIRGPLDPLLQPGGHGALWRTAERQGVFEWFRQQGKHHLVIRQINNPMGGVDCGLLALVGVGKKEDKAFGFASCERLPHTAEGVLVVKEKKGVRHLSNIEYSDFAKYGIEDVPGEDGYSPYPANTNILYADIRKLAPVISKTPLPGLMINMKQEVDGGVGGRLESMMQNICEELPFDTDDSLSTFITYNERKRTISVTKKSFEKGKSLIETPEGAFYDLLCNAHALLKDRCGVELSDFCSQEEYLEKGPSHVLIYHPVLGPLYTFIARKIHGGRFAKHFEAQLMIADLLLENCVIDGSLFIQALEKKMGKCVLKKVNIYNQGIDYTAPNCYWKNQIYRKEALKIILEGRSEFYAENLTLEGAHKIVVPHNERWIARQDAKRKLIIDKQRLSSQDNISHKLF